jgi:hypothetical protein
MSKERQKKSHKRKEVHLRFNLLGLIFFSGVLIAATGLSVSALKHSANKIVPQTVTLESLAPVQSNANTDVIPQVVPPWGELVTSDVQIDLPDEYVRLEDFENKIPPWIFKGMNLQQTRDLMLSCGLTVQQTEHALSPQHVSETGSAVVIQPDSDLIFSLSPDVRAKFYSELGKNPENAMMQLPIIFKNSFKITVSGLALDEKTISMVESLLYKRGGFECLSDYGALMSRLPLNEQRRRLIEAFFSQSTVIARLRIRPSTDIDKLLAYWCGSVNDCSPGLRSLLEAVQRRAPDGGSINVIDLLPEFARERLYTYPLPTQSKGVLMDCHWSTVNFINNSEAHFVNGSDIGTYVEANCYQITKPARFGDMIFLMDDHEHLLHSAVYIAGDIVFSKDGADFRQPWTLVRMNDMIKTYSALGATRMAVWRKKTVG